MAKHKGECKHCHRFLTMEARFVCGKCWRAGFWKLYPANKTGPKPDACREQQKLDRLAEEYVSVLNRAEQVLRDIADNQAMQDADNVTNSMMRLSETLHTELIGTDCEEFYLPPRTRKERDATT